MAKKYINSKDDYTAKYPNYVAPERKDFGLYDQITESITIPSTPDDNGKYIMVLDYMINGAESIVVTIDGNELVNVLFGIAPTASQVAINFEGIPKIEFHSSLAGKSGNVKYSPVGSYQSAAFDIEIAKEIEALQSISGGGSGGGSGAVDSVNGQTGTVVLDKSDVGLSNVDNTSDLDKPISTATQNALNDKVDSADLNTINLENLANVDGGASDEQVLAYNYDTATWVPTTIESGGNGLPSGNATEYLRLSATGDPEWGDPADLSQYIILDSIDKVSVNGHDGEYLRVRADGAGWEFYVPTASEVGAVPNNLRGMPNGVTPLNSNGKIDSVYLPSIAISNVYTVATESAMLSLIAETGDIAVRTDLDKCFINNGGTTGTISDWTLLLTPTAAVTSVAGRVGAIILTKSDVGLSNVDNVSDADKPISIATQNALNNKVNTSDLADYYDIATIDNMLENYAQTNHTHSISDITNLSTTLAGKSDTSHNHSLNTLSNVNISSIADGQALVWDSSSSKWINETITGTSGSYSALTGTSTQIASTDVKSVGTRNIGIGDNVFYLFASGTGTDNSAFGDSALYSLTHGKKNTAIGKNSLDNTTQGNANVGIGYNARTGALTGNAIALGANTQAPYNNSIALGANTTTTADNQVQFGNRDIVTGTTGTVKTSLVTTDAFTTTHPSIPGNITTIQWNQINTGTITASTVTAGTIYFSGGKTPAPSDHTHTLDSLSDVNTSGVTDGQALVYNNSFGQWTPSTISTGGTWGSITGSLSNQTDLQNALNLKVDTSTLSNYALTTHTHTLDSLSDVNTSGVTDGQALVWDSSSSKWVNETISGGGGSTVIATGTYTWTMDKTWPLNSATVTWTGLRDGDVITMQCLRELDYNFSISFAGGSLPLYECFVAKAVCSADDTARLAFYSINGTAIPSTADGKKLKFKYVINRY